jgi:hypothetical protein
MERVGASQTTGYTLTDTKKVRVGIGQYIKYLNG